MKPGPEHVATRWRHVKTGLVCAYMGRTNGGDFAAMATSDAYWTTVPLETFEADWVPVPITTPLGAPSPATVAPSADPSAAVISRLLATGFEHAELCLVATRELPTPSYRFIGYRGAESISYTLISDEPGALERVEEAVGEKLRALIEGERERG